MTQRSCVTRRASAPGDRGSAGSVASRAPSTKLSTRVESAVARARDALLGLQRSDGSWCFELEADCTIPAEYILMMHYLGEIDAGLQAKLAAYLRAHQAGHGGWPLYAFGRLDVSCSVKAYWALKLAGDDPDAAHMRRAREAILAAGGAARCNVFTRIAMALFGQVPWRAVPWLPVELVLAPRWFFFHLGKVSYWTRTVTVPLAVLCTKKPRAKNPTGLSIRELFARPPEEERDYFPVRSALNRAYLWAERTLRHLDPLIPSFVRRRALREAEAWFVARINGKDGLGGIFPAMVNALEALLALGYPRDHELCVQAREALRLLVVEEDDWAYCQPCFSPVWDTGLACLALQDAERALADARVRGAVDRALEWLVDLQVLDGPADWRADRPGLAPGGWAFQFRNDYYPDLDDTAVVVWAMALQDGERYAHSIARAADWIRGMQSEGGGFAAFDADNTHFHLNEIPFADHGALLDPPTADVSARCATMMALLARDADRDSLARCLDYLFDEQEDGGSWFGRWGTNYIYGTWSVLCALEVSDDPRRGAALRRAAEWLEFVQRADGSWGESNDSYADPSLSGRADGGTAFQTAWAVLGLIAAGRARGDAVRRGVEHLLATQSDDGLWKEERFTAPGFPRVFYLRYHGYSCYFPLWALARYRSASGAPPHESSGPGG